MHNSKPDRAKQFMPFAALRGYYDLIKECERIKEPKKVLSDSECDVLSDKLKKIKKGMLVKVKYYNTDAYEETTGLVTSFDETYKTLTIIKKTLRFDDIIDIFEVKY